MAKIKKAKIKAKDTKNKDLFSLFQEYLKETIKRDLRAIYGEEARFLNSEDYRGVYQLDRK